MRRALLLALLTAAPAAAEDYALPPAPSSGTRIDYQADRADYDAEASTLHLTGHVTLKQSTVTVKGEDLWIDEANRTGRSDKRLLIDDGVSAAYGESGDFDFAARTGRLYRASAGMGNWRVHAREARLMPGRELRYRSADFTSCDYVPPDYHFRASSLSIVPKKRVLAWNTLFYLGPVPLLYTPVFYHSLDPDPTLKWRFQPGVDSRNGQYVRGTLTTRVSTATYAKLFDDYYTNKGFGLGGELDHFDGNDSRGSLYGYRIHEDRTVNNRWGVFGSDYQKLGKTTAFQGRLQVQSDPTFTNDYARSDLFRLTPELVNSAALTRTFSKATVRLAYARDDVQNPATSNYVKSTEDAPRLEAQSVPLSLGLPWLNTFSGFADNNYTRGRSYLQKSVNAAWDATRSFRVARRVTYTPKLDYSETFYNEFDETDWDSQRVARNLDSSIARWTASNNLRFNSPIGNLDATHVYTQRLKPDGFTQDAGPADRGVEANQVNLSDVFVPTWRTWARVSTGYDYRTYRDHAARFSDRIQPITTDLSWQIRPKLAVTAHDAYMIRNSAGVGGNQALVADVSWGDPLKGPSVDAGLTYNLASPSTYYQSLILAYEPQTSSPTWRVTVALRTVLASNGGVGRVHSLRLFEKEATWSRRWHDFYTKVVFRARPGGVGEVAFRVEFLFGDTNPRTAPRRDWESQWYPERDKETGGP